MQGDVPFFDPKIIETVTNRLHNDPHADISTIVAPIDDEEDIQDPNVVKVVFDENQRALYFSRLPIPYPMSANEANYFYHVGIYGYNRDAIKKYIKLPQSTLEKREKLEQLRALENGMTICVDVTKNIPISIDVPKDLEYARMHAKKLSTDS